jgi:hypothetical protein
MTGTTTKTTVLRISAVFAASLAATGFLGAAPYEWAPIGKADRPFSLADCRTEKMNATDFCRGVELPETSTDAVEVAPGLTILQQSEG